MNILIIYGVILLVAFAISYILTPMAIKFAIKRDIIDNPKQDDRRVHKTPVPRVGRTGYSIYDDYNVSFSIPEYLFLLKR